MLGQEKSLFRSLLPHIVAIIAFIAITMVYFSPLYQNKVLLQGDRTLFIGSSQELREYYNEEGGSSAWTGAVFSGMPAYQIGIWGGSPNTLDYVEKPLRGLVNDTAGPLLMSLFIAYILFCLFGFKPAISFAGAIAYAFSSYNLIIIVAGHMTKAWAIAYIPLIVAGILVLFRRKYLLGGILMALGLGFQLKNNHMQMTYYTGILCAILYISLVIDFVKTKEFKGLAKATGVLLVAILLAFAANYANVYNNYLMSEESIRGTSELTKENEAEESKKSSGLDKEYTFQWSYGKAETFTFLIPDFHGGISKQFDKDSEPFKSLVKMMQSGRLSQQDAEMIYRYTYEYWGTQPPTSGPVYLGAIICFLFLLGMIIIKNDKLKWAMFAATVLFIFLSWGKNFEAFNDFFFYYFPFYNKFRAVSSALVIPAFTMVFIAIWGLKEFLSGEIERKKLLNALYISAGITGGLCFLFWIAPGAFFNFISPVDEQLQLSQTGEFYQAVVGLRKDMLSGDAFRSLIFILLAGAILWFSIRPVKNDNKATLSAVAIPLFIAILILVDLWNIDRRYINDDNYMSKAKYENETFKKTEADKFILQDKELSHRVLKLGNPFNENMTSYHHKSIGGHSAVKLRRYQELIDYYLYEETQYITNVCSKAFNTIAAKAQDDPQMNVNELFMSMQETVSPAFLHTPVLNMLNAKYIIYAGDYPPIVNPYAMGNAWFVTEYKFVDNADEEIAALEDIYPMESAIIDKRFEEQLKGLTIIPDSSATIEMIYYKPNKVSYKLKTVSEQLAVFSEIYFAEGWEVHIDGEPADYFRADWILRGMRVPAGEHEITFEFIPHAYNTSRTITTILSSILLLLVFAGFGFLIFNKKKEQ